MEEMVRYNGEMISYTKYMSIQKTLYNEMLERVKQHKLERNKPAKIIGCTIRRLNIEESQYLLLKIAKFVCEKIGNETTVCGAVQ